MHRNVAHSPPFFQEEEEPKDAVEEDADAEEDAETGDSFEERGEASNPVDPLVSVNLKHVSHHPGDERGHP